MSRNGKRRKPRLDEKRVRGIAATFEAEVGSANFEIRGVGLDRNDADEWHVIVRHIFPEGIFLDGGDSLVIINDQTGIARYYEDYILERNSRVPE